MPIARLRPRRLVVRPVSPSRRRPVPLTVEPLDDRVLLSATMVAQINHATADALDPSLAAVSFHGALYFTADDGHGGGVFRSDGTTAGTTLIKAFPMTDAYVPHALVVSGGSLFFTGDDGSAAGGLWKSDGTAAGTTLVKDVTLSAEGSFGAPELTDVNGTLYFTAYQGNSFHAQLWKSDGTAAGTTLVEDVDPSASSLTMTGLTNVNGAVYFATLGMGDGLGLQEQLWRSDGTAAGTVSVMSADGFDDLTAVNGALFFKVFDSMQDTTDLWKTDGSGFWATKVGVVSTSEQADTFASKYAALNGKLFYTGWDATNGSQLWESDGTAAGTHIVRLINAAHGGASPTDLTVANGTLYFAANDGTHGTELCKTDGTADGTVMLKDINPGPAGSLPDIFGFPASYHVTAVNDTVYFTADDGMHGDELWKTDGTAAGTVMVKDINPLPPDPAMLNPVNQVPRGSSAPTMLTAVGGQLFLMADDGSHGYQLWASDGSAAGTRMVKALNTTGAGADVQNLTVVNGTVFFTAYDSTTGPGLYKSDGTAAGTKLVWAGFAENLTNVNGRVFFTSWDATNGERLWKTDGTTTTLVSVLGHPTADPPLGNNPTAVNGLLFFTWDDGTHGNELWRSDGTATGTFMVKDIFPGAVSSYPFSLRAFDGALYFVTNDGVNNDAIWKSDGTAAGTVMVAAVQAGPDAIAGPSLIVTDLVAANGALFFTASDIIYSTFELGKTDGTAAGTVLLKAVDGTPLASVGGTLYFAVWAGSVGGLGGTGQLWKSDGTAAGTVMLAQLPGPAGGNASYPSSTATINGTLFFAVQGPNGPELWKSDGTARGTARVGAVAPEVDELGTPALANVGGTLYFVGQDSAHGRELWKTDGTAAGTALVQDINPGAGSSNPGGLVAVNGTLYFTADDGTHGQQLWALAGLTARGVAVKVQEGKKFSGLVATFTDPGSTAAAAAYAALITWGDGHTSAGTVTATGKGTYAVSGTNTYAHAGNYAVSVTITRSGGGMVMAHSTATVTDAPFWASRVFQRAKKGQSLAPVLGTLTDTNPFAVAGDFTLLIDWGDGQKSNGTLKANAQKTFDIDGTHTYSTTGFYTLSVTITEVGGQTVTMHPLIAVDA